MNTILESKRINFTEISETLIDDYLAMINDKEHVGKYIGCMKIFTKEEELEWVHGMNILGLTRLFLKAYPDNAKAIHVYEKCGFKEYDRTDEDVFMEIMK